LPDAGGKNSPAKTLTDQVNAKEFEPFGAREILQGSFRIWFAES